MHIWRKDLSNQLKKANIQKGARQWPWTTRTWEQCLWKDKLHRARDSIKFIFPKKFCLRENFIVPKKELWSRWTLFLSWKRLWNPKRYPLIEWIFSGKIATNSKRQKTIFAKHVGFFLSGKSLIVSANPKGDPLNLQNAFSEPKTFEKERGYHSTKIIFFCKNGILFWLKRQKIGLGAKFWNSVTSLVERKLLRIQRQISDITQWFRTSASSFFINAIYFEYNVNCSDRACWDKFLSAPPP